MTEPHHYARFYVDAGCDFKEATGPAATLILTGRMRAATCHVVAKATARKRGFVAYSIHHNALSAHTPARPLTIFAI